MKAINQSLIIHVPVSHFFPPAWWNRIRVKRLAWGYTYTKVQALGETCILTKPQRASAALCSPREARGIPKHTKGNSELFFPVYSFSFGGSCGNGEFQFEVFFQQDKQRGRANSHLVSCFILTPQEMCSCELFNSQPLFQVSTDCFSQDCRKDHCTHTSSTSHST